MDSQQVALAKAYARRIDGISDDKFDAPDMTAYRKRVIRMANTLVRELEDDGFTIHKRFN